MASKIVYIVAQFFKKQKEHKFNIYITAVTSEATRVLEKSHVLDLKKVRNILRRGNYVSLSLKFFYEIYLSKNLRENDFKTKIFR